MKIYTHTGIVDNVMASYGLTTLTELDDAFGVCAAERIVVDKRGEQREKDAHCRELSPFNPLESLVMSPWLYREEGIPADVTPYPWQRLAYYYNPSALSDYAVDDMYRNDEVFRLRYPMDGGKNSQVQAFKYIVRDYPEHLNRTRFLDDWCAENPAYAAMAYDLLGLEYPKDGPMASLAYADGHERTILLSDGEVMRALWRGRFRKDVSSEYPYRNGIRIVHPNCHVERLLVEDASGRIRDLLLVWETANRLFSDGFATGADMQGAFSALLFVASKDTPLPPVMYYRTFRFCFNQREGREYCRLWCRDRVSEFVTQKTGLRFADFRSRRLKCPLEPKGIDWEVFPSLFYGTTELSSKIKSQVMIMRDVEAPSYASFTCGGIGEIKKADTKRLGTAVSFLPHNHVGFWGGVPTHFVTADGSHPDGSPWRLGNYLKDSFDIVVPMGFSETDLNRCSDTEMQSAIGIATKIARGDGVLLELENKVPIFFPKKYGILYRDSKNSYKRSDAADILWEPDDITPVALKDLNELFVALIAADTSAGEPDLFWVLSESNRWYEYSYFDYPDTFKRGELGDMLVCGLADESVVLNSASCAIVLAKEHAWKEHRRVYEYEHDLYSVANGLTGRGDDKEVKVPGLRTIGTGKRRMISMMNDMRPLWRYLTSSDGMANLQLAKERTDWGY